VRDLRVSAAHYAPRTPASLNRPPWRRAAPSYNGRGAGARRPPATPEERMSKGMDQKKDKKKEPTKTLKEKRAAKQEKKNGKK
jgi:hypothetical protein